MRPLQVLPFRVWVLAVIVFGMLAANTGSCYAESNLKMVIVDAGYDYPEVTIPILSIHSDESVSITEGGTLNDKQLAEVVGRRKLVDGKQMCLVRVQSSTEKEVSMQVLGKVLQRMRSLADPGVPTVFYVYLRELPYIEEKVKKKP